MSKRNVLLWVVLTAIVSGGGSWWVFHDPLNRGEGPVACRWDSGGLTISYMYGAGDFVMAPTVTVERDRVTVAIRSQSSGGSAVAVALGGRASFEMQGAARPVYGPDGKPIPCAATEG